MTWFRLFLLLALCLPSLADSSLDALHATLIEMRGKSPDSGGPRGATPSLTVVKHQLRDWVESRLKGLALRGDEGELGRRLNEELREASWSVTIALWTNHDVPSGRCWAFSRV
jgi:hypothetical protein